MRKPAFCIFCGLCILTSFSLLTVNVRGVSNKHCLLPFFIMFVQNANLRRQLLLGKEAPMQEAQLRNQQLTEQLEVMEKVVAQKAQATSAVRFALK